MSGLFGQATDGRTVFDVAISLRWTDVKVAQDLYDRLRDRVEVFFADERTEEFAGTDGEQSFAEIYRDRARVVVVLYRPDWGETKFTAAERSAIKQRASDEDYGFSLWVTMGSGTKPPPYLPPEFIYYDFETYGIDGLAATIENRVRDTGRKVRPRTALDQLRDMKRKTERVERIKEFTWSPAAISRFDNDIAALPELVAKAVRAVDEVDSDLLQIPKSTPVAHRSEVGVVGYGRKLVVSGRRHYSNNLEANSIEITLQRGSGNRPHDFVWHTVTSASLRLTLDKNIEPAWTEDDQEFAPLERFVTRWVEMLALEAARSRHKAVSRG